MRELPTLPDSGSDEPVSNHGLCQECGAGAYRLERITYFTWLNDELVTVPNFPAWVCDVCGRREYDPRAILWLNTLLHPDAKRRSAATGRYKPGKFHRPAP